MAVNTLIVDDSVAFRSLLSKRLERIGCTILAEAGNARQALDLFHAIKPDLVTMDLMMPDEPSFTSRELFQTIRAESPKTAIIVISVQSKVANAATFLSEGAAAYLEKSFINFDEVRKKLESLFPELKRTDTLQSRVRR
ncbi:MAG TPA: response regulator [Candidatus Binataceae bacterium]|nr:response regulator [Candidatus Binataceae bacterium]